MGMFLNVHHNVFILSLEFHVNRFLIYFAFSNQRDKNVNRRDRQCQTALAGHDRALICSIVVIVGGVAAMPIRASCHTANAPST